MNQVAETGCCPRFDAEPWNDKDFSWSDRRFVKDRIRCLFHIPITFGKVMKRNMPELEEAGVLAPDHMTLYDARSMWSADVYFAVTGEVAGRSAEEIPGEFRARVFNGPYSKVHRWTQEWNKELQASGQPSRRTLYWYTTCPRCAKAYGENHIVIFAQR